MPRTTNDDRIVALSITNLALIEYALSFVQGQSVQSAMLHIRRAANILRASRPVLRELDGALAGTSWDESQEGKA